MPMKKWLAVFISFTISILLSSGAAMANGTITATFIYNGSGVNQPLSGAYVYLHTYPPLGSPIMQRYFRNAQYILGPSDANGNISVSVPEGTYRIRITRRAPLTSTPTQSQAYGPPRTGDYTWYDPGATVTVATGSVVNLGTVYAQVFGSAPITITGRLLSGSNYPIPGYFVYATFSPCTIGSRQRHWGSCPTEYPAILPTDANGNFTIYLRDPGTLYIYGSARPHGAEDNKPVCLPGCCPVTVTAGENLNLGNIIW